MFPYTAEGKRAAAAYAKATNQTVEDDKKSKDKPKGDKKAKGY